MYPEIEVEISNTQGHLPVDLASIDQLVRIVLTAQGRSRASISIAVVDNATIHAINRAHLGHDWPTDVITFPLTDVNRPVLEGELVISAETACNAAREFGTLPGDELALYVVHGLLHLCGFDDHDEADCRRMRKREQELLSSAAPHCSYSRIGEPSAESRPGQQTSGPRLVTQKREVRPWTA